MATPQLLGSARSCWAWILVATLAVGLALATSVSAAVVFTVDSLMDQVDDNPVDGICHTAANHCTLRAAIMSANRASGAGATISVPAGLFTLVIPATVADGDEDGDLNLDVPTGYAPGPTTIIGAGSSATIIDANGIDRVLGVAAGRTVTISGVTLRNGVAAQLGGGINNAGTLTLNNTVLSANVAGERGGGICNVGTLTLNRSTVDGNMTPSTGGGGGLYSEGLMQVMQSTISNNTANDGGGILILFGSLFVTNSTIASNNALRDGGGIYNLKTSNVYNTTIVGNQAAADNTSGGTGGGVYNASSHIFNLRNTVIAGNYLSGSPIYDDCTGVLSIYGNNRFWSVSGCTIDPSGGGSADYLASLAELGALQNNGGPTQTIALVSPSGMIDGADAVFGCVDENGALATDQRSHPRVAGVRCDIGAFEYDDIIFADGFN